MYTRMGKDGCFHGGNLIRPYLHPFHFFKIIRIVFERSAFGVCVWVVVLFLFRVCGFI